MKLLLHTYIFGSVVSSLVVPTFSKQAAIADEFADPSLIQEPNGQYWSFASSNGLVNVPVARSPDFLTWQLQSFDALPNAGPWTDDDIAVLAPDVNRLVRLCYHSALQIWMEHNPSNPC